MKSNPKTKAMKPKPKPKKPAKKVKQKQTVRQSVKVNVQSSGGSGGGGSSIPTIPQYIPQQYYQSVPQAFQDRRGEDVILQRLSEIVDKFNAKPELVEDLPKANPQPTEYIDGPSDANLQADIINSNRLILQPRNTSNDNIQQQIEDAKKSVADEFWKMKQDIETLKNQKQKSRKPIISVQRDYQASAKKGWETKRKKAEEETNIKQAEGNAFWAEDDEDTANDIMANKYYEEKGKKSALKKLSNLAVENRNDPVIQELKNDLQKIDNKNRLESKIPKASNKKGGKMK